MVRLGVGGGGGGTGMPLDVGAETLPGGEAKLSVAIAGKLEEGAVEHLGLRDGVRGLRHATTNIAGSKDI